LLLRLFTVTVVTLRFTGYTVTLRLLVCLRFALIYYVLVTVVGYCCCFGYGCRLLLRLRFVAVVVTVAFGCVVIVDFTFVVVGWLLLLHIRYAFVGYVWFTVYVTVVTVYAFVVVTFICYTRFTFPLRLCCCYVGCCTVGLFCYVWLLLYGCRLRCYGYVYGPPRCCGLRLVTLPVVVVGLVCYTFGYVVRLLLFIYVVVTFTRLRCALPLLRC